MKRILTLLFILLLALPGFSQTNPNWEYYRTMRWKAKSGQADDFKKAAAKKTQMFNNSPENAIVTYQMMTGPDQGMFERVQVARTLDNLYNADNTKELEYWAKNVTQFAENPEGGKIWWRIKGWSANWEEGGTPSKYMDVQIITIKTANTSDFRRYMTRRMEIIKENSTRKIAVFKISSGSQLGEFRIITFFDDPMKAMGEWKSEDFDFEDAYNEKYGFNAYMTDRDLYTKAFEIYGNLVETHKLVPEMSFMGN